MTLRDLMVAAIVLASLPSCFRRPLVGLMMFSCSVHALQDLAWGFAKFERWSFYVILVTLAGYAVSTDKRLPVFELRTVIMICMVLFIGSGYSGLRRAKRRSSERLRVHGVREDHLHRAVYDSRGADRDHLRLMVWVIALSFAFYG